MRWHLLDAITELVPGRFAAGTSSTGFPEELFADHFPTFPTTPGVLLVEMLAQLSGKLLQATIWDQRGIWALPVLTMIYDVKFRSFVPPHSRLQLETEFEELRPESAIFKARVLMEGKRHANARLVLAFDPQGRPYHGDRDRLEDFGRSELARLGSPWSPGPRNGNGNGNGGRPG